MAETPAPPAPLKALSTLHSATGNGVKPAQPPAPGGRGVTDPGTGPGAGAVPGSAQNTLHPCSLQRAGGTEAAQEGAEGGWWHCWEALPIRTGPSGVHLTASMTYCSLSTALLHLGLQLLLLGILTSSSCSTRWPRTASSSSGGLGQDTGLGAGHRPRSACGNCPRCRLQSHLQQVSDSAVPASPKGVHTTAEIPARVRLMQCYSLALFNSGPKNHLPVNSFMSCRGAKLALVVSRGIWKVTPLRYIPHGSVFALS